MPGFDVAAAQQAGYSEDEIISYLTSTRKFDVAGAQNAGYSKQEIISHLSSQKREDVQPEASSAAARFGSALWSKVSPVEAVKGVAAAASDPIGTAKGMLDAQGQLWERAKSEFDKGNYADAAAAALHWAIPILGPEAYDAGQDLSQGRYAEGFGKTAGIGLNIAGPAALSKVKGVRITPGLANRNPKVSAAVASEQAAGVEIPASVATGNTGVRIAQRAAETTPLGSIVGDAARQRVGESLVARGRTLATRTSPSMQVPETAGASVRGGVEQAISTLKAEADNSYSAFNASAQNPRNIVNVQVGTKTVTSNVLDAKGNPVTSTVPVVQRIALPVDMRSIKAHLRPQFEAMSKWMEPAKRNASQGYQAIKSIIEGPDYISAVDAEKGLGGLKSLSREAASPDLRNQSQGIAANIITTLQSKIDTAARKAGVLDDLKAGRAAHASKMEAGEVLRKLRDEPVQLFNQTTFQGDAGIEQLRNLNRLAPQEMPKIGRAYLEKLLDTATAEGSFSRGQGLFGQWQKLGPETKKILFKNPLHIRDLDNFFLVAKKLSEEVNPSQSAMTGHSIGSMGLLLADPVAGVVYNIGAAGLTKMLYSPKGVRLLTKGLQVPLGNKAAAASAVAEILKLAGDDATPIPQMTPATATP